MNHKIEFVNGRETEVALMKESITPLLRLNKSSATTPAIALETESIVTADHLGQADLHHLEIHKNPTDSKRYLLNKLHILLQNILFRKCKGSLV